MSRMSYDRMNQWFSLPVSIFLTDLTVHWVDVLVSLAGGICVVAGQP
jgi:hypothetical protein